MKADREFLLLLVLAVASSFAPLSVDFFAPSVPAAIRSFDASINTFQVSIYAFFSGFALGSLFWGAFADRSERFRALTVGMGVYIAASLLCSLAGSLEVFGALRFLQGTGVAAGTVIARAVLRDIYGSEGITVALSKLLAIMVWIPALAPVIGGYLSWYLHWRISFLVMGIVALLALAGVYLCVPRSVVGKAEPMLTAAPDGWRHILRNRQFLRNALSNMFVMATIILFMSHYAYLTETYYAYESTNNGALLTAFNMTIFAGIIGVKYLLRHGTVEQVILSGLLCCVAGWAILFLFSLGEVPHLLLLIFPTILACTGMGAVYALCGGQALVPFNRNAGKASAVFMFLQSGGVALLVYLGAVIGVDSIATLALIMLVCALLSISCRVLLRG